MKIKLIAPARKPEWGESLWDLKTLCKISGNNAPCAPLSLLTIASLTPLQHDIKIVDENVQKINFDQPVDLVGLTFLTCYAPRAYEIADEFKARGVKVVLGGVHSSMIPEEALKYADSIIVGEAEELWPKAIEDFKKGALKKIYSPGKPFDLASSPIPRWDLVDEKNYFTLTLQTSRGCPHNCNFCSVTAFNGHKVRHKPIEKVIIELENLKKLNPKKTIFFVDDNLFVDKKYGLNLLNRIEPLGIRWMCQTSLGKLNDDYLLKKMNQSGCSSVFVGFESISENSLNAMNKNLINKPLDYPKIIDKIHSHGISIFGSFIIGTDGETGSIFRDTYRFIEKMNIPFAMINILTPFPGTELFAKLHKEGRITDWKWQNFNGENLCFEPSLQKDQLIEGRSQLIRKIYKYGNIYNRLNYLWGKGVLVRRSRNFTKSKFKASLKIITLKPINWFFANKGIWNKKNGSLIAILMAINFYYYSKRIIKHRTTDQK